MTDTPKSYPQTFLEAAPGACRMVLVRHGQSIPWVEGTDFPMKDGHGDPPLSPRGEWQAVQVGERLRHEPITAIYASTLQRTQQTAAPLAEHLGLDIQIEPDIREVFLGDWDGGLFRQMSADGHPIALEMRTTREWGAIPGAETNAELRARTSAAVLSIALRHPDEIVGVFCHGGVIDAILGHVTNTPGFTFRGARNASVSYLYVSADEWIIRSFNDATHIGSLTEDADPA